MSWVCYALRAPTREEATSWLRRKLAMVRDEAPPPEPRPIKQWAHGTLRAEVGELQPGMSVLVELAGGATWAGEVRAVTGTTLMLVPWGADEMVIRLNSITACRIVPEHTWAEQRVVAERQRRGEPALLLGVRKPKEK